MQWIGFKNKKIALYCNKVSANGNKLLIAVADTTKVKDEDITALSALGFQQHSSRANFYFRYAKGLTFHDFVGFFGDEVHSYTAEISDIELSPSTPQQIATQQDKDHTDAYNAHQEPKTHIPPSGNRESRGAIPNPGVDTGTPRRTSTGPSSPRPLRTRASSDLSNKRGGENSGDGRPADGAGTGANRSTESRDDGKNVSYKTRQAVVNGNGHKDSADLKPGQNNPFTDTLVDQSSQNNELKSVINNIDFSNPQADVLNPTPYLEQPAQEAAKSPTLPVEARQNQDELNQADALDTRALVEEEASALNSLENASEKEPLLAAIQQSGKLVVSHIGNNPGTRLPQRELKEDLAGVPKAAPFPGADLEDNKPQQEDIFATGENELNPAVDSLPEEPAPVHLAGVPEAAKSPTLPIEARQNQDELNQADALDTRALAEETPVLNSLEDLSEEEELFAAFRNSEKLEVSHTGNNPGTRLTLEEIKKQLLFTIRTDIQFAKEGVSLDEFLKDVVGARLYDAHGRNYGSARNKVSADELELAKEAYQDHLTNGGQPLTDTDNPVLQDTLALDDNVQEDRTDVANKGSDLGEKTTIIDSTAEMGNPNAEDMLVLEDDTPADMEEAALLPNFHVSDQEAIVPPTGEVGRFKANIDAAKLLKELEGSPSKALTEEQQIILGSFTGFGGIANRLETDEEAKGLLNAYEIELTRESSLTAYYTPELIVEHTWNMLEKGGYSGGRVLEPSAGTGAFIKGRPKELDHNQHFTAVEIEPISAQIMRKTLPSTRVFNSGFEQVRFAEKAYDLVIGNVPFGEYSLYDQNYASRSIHNYFIDKSIDLLDIDGVLVIATSTSTLDAKNKEFRTDIAKRADLLAAIRLPNKVFSGTTASVDFLVFKKRHPAQQPGGLPFIETQTQTLPTTKPHDIIKVGTGKNSEAYMGQAPIAFNEVFLPENEGLIGGRGTVSQDRFGKIQLDVEGDHRTISRAFIEAGDLLGGDWVQAVNLNDIIAQAPKGPTSSNTLNNLQKRLVVGSYQAIDNNPVLITTCEREYDYTNGSTTKHFRARYEKINIPDNARALVLSGIELKEEASALLEYESSHSDDSEHLQGLRQSLNAKYDKFTFIHGELNDKKVRKHFKADAEIALLLSLERLNRSTKKYVKADIFQRRVIKPAKVIDTATNLYEATALSIGKFGKINVEYIERLLEQPIDNLVLATPKIILLDPQTNEWRPRAVVLSGNVRQKLELAKTLVQTTPHYLTTAKELEEVLPRDIPSKEIGIGLSSLWVDNTHIEAFVVKQLSDHGVRAKATVTRNSTSGDSSVRVNTKDRLLEHQVIERELGTKRINFYKILESALIGRTIKIMEPGNEGMNIEATLSANAKLEELEGAFQKWVWSDPDRATSISKQYNELFNSFHSEPYIIEDYTFPGMSIDWQPKPHQRDFVVRALQSGNSLAAHCVGAGKTMEMVMLQMEKKRLGLANKPTIAVPNNVLPQLVPEAQNIYPNARIATITTNDLKKENIKFTMHRIAMNDWDIVVITHGILNRLTVPLENKIQTMKDVAFERLKLCKSVRDKNIVRAKTLTAAAKVNFEEDSNTQEFSIKLLGIDSIALDEAHMYKNLEIDAVGQMEGLSMSKSARAGNLLEIANYLRSIHGGQNKGLDFFTGTPVSNSITELYTMARYLNPDILKSMGCHNFNDWISAFGSKKTNLEALPEGSGFQLKTRYSAFKNLPELIASFRSFSDVKTRADLDLPVPKYTTSVITVEPSPWQKRFNNYLAARATNLRSGQIDPSVDNLLMVIGEGRKSALDMRLIDPRIPPEDNKTVSLVDNVANIHTKTIDIKGAQLIFCDVSTPKAQKNNNEFTVYSSIKDQLIGKGIPADEIAFIHDAKTDVQKEALCEKTRHGEVRVLLGSTGKLGTGTNVQRLLVAAHDLDVPWRPSDLEQRLGRTVRQGNLNKQVELYRYTTVDSFDLFMYETNNRKAAFIEQIMRDPKNTERTYDEETDINYNDVVAITTGNPHIREKVEVDATVMKLSRAEAAFNMLATTTKHELTSAHNRLERLQHKYSSSKENIQMLNEHLKLTNQKQFALTLDGPILGFQEGSTTYIDKTLAAKAMRKAIDQTESKSEGSVRFGEVYGLPVNVVFYHDRLLDGLSKNIGLGNNQFQAFGTAAPHTMIRQLRDHLARGMVMTFKECRYEITQTETLIKNAKQYDENATYPDAEELTSARDRQKVLNLELIEYSKNIETPDTFLEDLQAYIATLPEDQQAIEGYRAPSSVTPNLDENDRVVMTVNQGVIEEALGESLQSETMH